MKKVVFLVAVVLLVSILVSSCTTGQRCAAYGERSRYQVERH